MTAIFYLSYGALWVLLLVQGLLLLMLYRHFGLVTLGTEEGVKRDGLAVGEFAPAFQGIDTGGEHREWDRHPHHPTLLLFVTPDCAPCAQVMPAVGALRRHNPGLEIAAVVPGRIDALARFVDKYHPSFACFADNGRQVFDRYRVRVTPFAFVIGVDGRIRAKGLCSDPSRLRALLSSAGLGEAAAAIALPMVSVANGAGIPVGAKEG